MALVEDGSYEETMLDVLNILSISEVAVQRSDDGLKKLIQFFVESEQVEPSLICLQQHGIGTTGDTLVSVIPTTIHIKPRNVQKLPRSTASSKGTASGTTVAAIDEKVPTISGGISAKSNKKSKSLEQMVDSFYASIKSRMLVAEVITRIEGGAKFNFDYVAFLVLAGAIAFFGLLENSSVTLVASMLVSPLMGPILAGIFGAVVLDKDLRSLGMKVELISLIMCILLGFVLGLIFSPWIEYYGVTQWPTPEMVSRGQLRSLMAGVFIAVPSGAGVALSVLGGNTGSLVGVAISASLLPPAVNAGLLWAMALVATVSKDESHIIGWGRDSPTSPINETLYTFTYSSNMPVEASILGLVSLTLTLVNIICIILTGVGILKLKEVTPDKIPQQFSTFWKHDIRTHRDYYSTVKKDNEKNLLEEARDVLGIGNAAPGQGSDQKLEGTFLQTMFEEARKDKDVINIREWTAQPLGSESPLPSDGSIRAARSSEDIRKARFSAQLPKLPCLDENGEPVNYTRQRLYSQARLLENIGRNRKLSQNIEM